MKALRGTLPTDPLGDPFTSICFDLYELHYFCLFFSLEKDFSKRPNYAQLMESAFLVAAEQRVVDMAAFISHVLDDLPDPPPEKKPEKRR